MTCEKCYENFFICKCYSYDKGARLQQYFDLFAKEIEVIRRAVCKQEIFYFQYGSTRIPFELMNINWESMRFSFIVTILTPKELPEFLDFVDNDGNLLFRKRSYPYMPSAPNIHTTIEWRLGSS